MGEVLVVVWRTEQLELYQIPSEGTWRSPTTALGLVELDRPTRLSLFDDRAFSARFVDALGDLFKGVEITLPVWFLLPADWVNRFNLPNPGLAPAELNSSHLLWEAEQRLHGDISGYRALLPADIPEGEVTVRLVRSELVDALSMAMRSAGVEAAGIGVEPDDGADYTFEVPLDLREAMPLEQAPTSAAKSSGVTIPPVVGIGVAAVAAAIVAVLLLLPPVKPPQKTAQQPAEKPSPAAQTPTPAEPKETPEKTTAAAPAGQPEPAPAQVAADSSPLRLVVSNLPKGARVTLATLSPVDFKVDVAGLGNPDNWLKQFRTATGLSGIQKAGGYRGEAGAVASLRLARPGFKAGTGARDLDLWKRLATQAGMKVRGRSASGSLDAALELFDRLARNPAGFSKVYFAAAQGGWMVTVQ